MKRLQAIVSGSVHGVFLRDFTRRTAIQLGVLGFVHNLPNGTVELVAEGTKEILEELLARIRKEYPLEVKQIDATWSLATGEFADFRILKS